MTAGSVVSTPVVWSPAIYESDHGIGLSVCVEHRGAHAWYLGRCVPVGERTVLPVGPFRPCSLHDGRHLYVRGHCLNPGGRYAYRYGRCPVGGCEVEVCHRLDVLSGRTERLDAETDRPHGHESAVQIEIDEGGLAHGIARALDELMERRRHERRAESSADRRPPPPAAAHAAPAPAEADISIPTVTVWSPGSTDGPGT
jgi:hypothetical protein